MVQKYFNSYIYTVYKCMEYPSIHTYIHAFLTHHEHLASNISVGSVWRAEHVRQGRLFQRGERIVHQVVALAVGRQHRILVPEVPSQTVDLTVVT